MDPFIEGQNRWPDFHHEFISQARAAINSALPEDYVATINERVQTIELVQNESRLSLPDVAISMQGSGASGKRAAITGNGGTATLDPETLPQASELMDEPTEGFIEIYHLPEYRLVTGIELLSPSNKVNPGRIAYLAKRRDLLHHGVNLVEVDLLLGGSRLPMLAPLPAGDYFAFVTRAATHDRCDVYAWSIRQSLPAIPIPLKASDPEIQLDLSAPFRASYEVGRYARILRYDRAVDLELAPADREWAHVVSQP